MGVVGRISWRRRVRACIKTMALAGALALSALLMSVAVRSDAWAWSAWISVVPLFWAIRALNPIKATLSGAFWGLCLYTFATATSLTPLIPLTAGLTTPISPLSTGLTPGISPGLVTFTLMTIIPAAYVALGALLTRAIGFNPPMLALAWILVEVALRPLGLRHGLLAGTQGNALLIHGVGILLICVFIAFLVACANASLLPVLSHARLRLPRHKSLAELPKSGACPSSQTSLYLQLWSLRQAYPRGPPIQVAAMSSY